MFKLGVGLLLLVLVIFALKTSFNAKSTQESRLSYTSSPTSVSQPSPDPVIYPKVQISDLGNGEKLLEIEEYKLSLHFPASWSYEEGRIRTLKHKGLEYYSGYILLKDESKLKSIEIIPNLQGDWCSGPSKVEKIKLKSRFNLPGTKFICGDSHYLYGDLEQSSAIPNLYIQTNSDSDKQTQAIISSIKYATD